MKLKKIILCFLLIGISTLYGCFFKEKSVLLQYKYKEGECLKYKLTTISKGTVTINNLQTEGTQTSIPSIEVETKGECILTQKVMGIDEGGVANIEISYDFINQNVKIGKDGISSSFFSPKVENTFLNSIEGKKINIKLARDGSILGITGIEEIGEQLLAQMQEKASLDEGVIRKVEEDVKQNIISGIGENYCRLPVEEMKVGDVWIREQDYKIPFLGMAHGRSTYTMEEFTQIKEVECVKIGIEVAMNVGEKGIEDLEDLLNMPSLEVKVNGNAQGKGKMIFAYQEGKLINSDLKINMNMEIGGEKIPTMDMNFTIQGLVELQ